MIIPSDYYFITFNLYIYTLIIIFFRVRWNKSQIDFNKKGMVKTMRKGGQ